MFVNALFKNFRNYFSRTPLRRTLPRRFLHHPLWAISMITPATARSRLRIERVIYTIAQFCALSNAFAKIFQKFFAPPSDPPFRFSSSTRHFWGEHRLQIEPTSYKIHPKPAFVKPKSKEILKKSYLPHPLPPTFSRMRVREETGRNMPIRHTGENSCWSQAQNKLNHTEQGV